MGGDFNPGGELTSTQQSSTFGRNLLSSSESESESSQSSDDSEDEEHVGNLNPIEGGPFIMVLF